MASKRAEHIIYRNGAPGRPTQAEEDTPTAYESPFTGCPCYVVHKGHKYWCQNGEGTKVGANHAGGHHG